MPVKTVLNSGKVPVKLWLDDIEKGTLKQIANLSDFPYAFSHIAIMPDAHKGYGMPIGGVMATEKVVVPNAVGVDIGCGMCALKTDVRSLKKSLLKKILNDLRKIIPLGFKHHKKPLSEKFMPEFKGHLKIVNKEYSNALTQIGTLGGGNHFMEIQKGSDGFIWLMVHSGSRNLGYKVASHYNKIAKKLRDRFENNIPASWQLDFLSFKSKEGQDYIDEMNYCIKFAFANRKLMMKRFLDVFSENSGGGKNKETGSFVNIAHNYASEEIHFGKRVIVHRKGATSAKNGERGIIPGSQGAKSYIVVGKGVPLSFCSCAHGAGRKMSRRAAVRKLKFKDELYKLEKHGVLHSLFKKKNLDEASGAYKNIEDVMSYQKDLVDIEIELSPLAVLKSS